MISCTIDKALKRNVSYIYTYSGSSYSFMLTFNFNAETLRFGAWPVCECGGGTAPSLYPSNPGGRCFCKGHVSGLMVMKSFIIKFPYFDNSDILSSSIIIRCTDVNALLCELCCGLLLGQEVDSYVLEA